MSQFRFFIYDTVREQENPMCGKVAHLSFPSHAKAEEWIRDHAWRKKAMEIRFEAAWKTPAELSIVNNSEA